MAGDDVIGTTVGHDRVIDRIGGGSRPSASSAVPPRALILRFNGSCGDCCPRMRNAS
jgi:hypothetical protein